MVVSSAVCLRRGRRSICSMRRKSLRLGLSAGSTATRLETKKCRLLKRENTEELKKIAISAEDPTLKNEIVGALGLNGDTSCRKQLSGQQDLCPLQSCAGGRGAP